MAHVQCDKGGISHILSGSDVMAPGLTSEGGRIDMQAKEGDPVAIMAEGKVHAMAIGILRKAPQKIIEENKGKVVESVTYLNDGLWNF